MVGKTLFERYYPADWVNGEKRFYDWIRCYLRPEFVFLDVGAGRGTGIAERSFRGEVREVVGIDIDGVVLENREVDRAGVIPADGRFPVGDGEIDLAWSDFVLEHVEQPVRFLEEVHRILKPGGMFFFRTPNRRHYVSFVSRIVPASWERNLANWARGFGDGCSPDVNPKFYRMNTFRVIRDAAEKVGLRVADLYGIEAQPSYLMFHPVTFLVGVAYERIVNQFELLSGLRANIFGRLVK